MVKLPKNFDPSFSDSLRTMIVEMTTESWNFWFGLLQLYSEKNGHSNVPVDYKTKEDLKLGQWVISQRSKKDTLSPERRSRLDALGFEWDINNFLWEEGFSHLKKFVEKEGHSRIPQKFKTEDGYKLGQWASMQRTSKDSLETERRLKLDAIGFDWHIINTRWEKGFSHLLKFVEQKGHIRVPPLYKSEDGYHLGSWVQSQRQRKDRMEKERKSRLDDIGFDWDPFQTDWEEGFSHLKEFVNKEGHARVTQGFETDNDYKLE